jgi:hypothetical protein
MKRTDLTAKHLALEEMYRAWMASAIMSNVSPMYPSVTADMHPGEINHGGGYLFSAVGYSDVVLPMSPAIYSVIAFESQQLHMTAEQFEMFREFVANQENQMERTFHPNHIIDLL